jgi:hypothetical protein
VDRSGEPILGFNVGIASPAILMRPEAVVAYQDGIRAWDAGNPAVAEASFARAIAAQRPEVENFKNEAVRLMARVALANGSPERADSLNQIDFRMSGATSSYFGMAAQIAYALSDWARSRELAERCLALKPGDDEGTMVIRALDERAAGR